MKPRPEPPCPSGTSAQGLPEAERTTRGRVLAVVVEDGPVTTSDVAARLGLTAAAVRRHVEAMAADGLLEAREAPRVAGGARGPGRPARRFVATPRAHASGRDAHADLAVDVLRFLAATQGREAVRAFAERRADELGERYGPALAQAGPDVQHRATVLAELLGQDGYAASTRPVGRGTAVAAAQLCQGHCPVQRAATEFPELCDAETAAISSLLGVETRRLATLGAGDHVCTTHIPLAPTPGARGPAADRPRTGTAHQSTTRTDDGPAVDGTADLQHTSSSPEGPRR